MGRFGELCGELWKDLVNYAVSCGKIFLSYAVSCEKIWRIIR